MLSYILITGDAGRSIKKQLQNVGYEGEVLEYEDMQSAFILINKYSKEGDVCLLSPAAASYDRYKNFEERGKAFKEFANNF